MQKPPPEATDNGPASLYRGPRLQKNLIMKVAGTMAGIMAGVLVGPILFNRFGLNDPAAVSLGCVICGALGMPSS